MKVDYSNTLRPTKVTRSFIQQGSIARYGAMHTKIKIKYSKKKKRKRGRRRKTRKTRTWKEVLLNNSCQV